MAARIDWPLWASGAGLALAAVPLGVLAGVNPQLAVTAVLVAVFALVAFTDLAMGLALFVFMSFLGLFPYGDYDTAARLLLVMAWFAVVMTKRKSELEFPSVHPIVAAAMILFVAWAFVSTAWAEDTAKAIDSATQYGLSALLLLVTFTAVRTRTDLNVILIAFLLGAVGAVISGLISPQDPERLESYILDANLLAAALVAGLAIAIAVIALNKDPAARLLAGLAAILVAVGILLTTSRSAVIALGVCLVSAIALAGRWRVGAIVIAVVAVSGTYIYFAQFAPETARERIEQPLSGEQRSEDGRSTIWQLAWRAFEDNPVAGVGAGNFPVVQVRYLLEPGVERAHDQVIDDPKGKVAHSSYLSVLSELGLIGFALFIFVVGACGYAALRAARVFGRAGEPQLQVAAAAVAIALLGLLVVQAFQSDQQGTQLWLLLGLGPALLAMAQRARSVSSS